MKRFACIFLAILVMLSSAFVMTTAAEEVTNPDCIYFQVPNSGAVAWKNFSIVFCHIWQEGDEGGDFYAWQAKDERCEDLGNGYFRYDISGLTFKEDGTYSVIFSNENGMQTYNLTLTSDCKGDIVVCDGETCENPVDNQKQCAVARWSENKDKVHPCAVFSSDGVLLDPDGVFGEDVTKKWGTSQGVSIVMPEVEVPTEEPTQEEAEEEDIDIQKSNTGSVAVLPLILLIGGIAVGVVAIVVVAVVLISKKKK